jgi:hypothetical protein
MLHCCVSYVLHWMLWNTNTTSLPYANIVATCVCPMQDTQAYMCRCRSELQMNSLHISCNWTSPYANEVLACNSLWRTTYTPSERTKRNQFDLEDPSHISRVFLEQSRDDYVICLPLVAHRHWEIDTTQLLVKLSSEKMHKIAQN